MFVKNKLVRKSHKHSRKYQNRRNLLQILHSFTFPRLCTLLAGSIILTQTMLAFGQTQNGMVQGDLRSSNRHVHRQQSQLLSLHRRSIQSNNGAPSNQLPISEVENKLHPGGVGSSSGRPQVCASCMARELYRNLTLMEIKKDILKKLKMEHGPPQVSRKDFDVHMMGQIVDRYRKMNDHMDQYGVLQRDEASNGGFEDDNEFSTTNQVTVLAQKPNGIVPQSIIQQWEIQYFSLDALLRKEDFKAHNAKLYVHLPADHGPVSQAKNANKTFMENESQEMVYYGDEAWVYLYYVSVDKKTGVGSLILTEATRVQLLANRGGWIDIDMMEILSVWRKYPSENLGLQVIIKTKYGATVPVGVQHQITNVPFLQIDLEEDTWSQRSRRNTPKTCREDEDKNHEECCLWEFEVDFEADFGWEWVIHPTKYKANYCNGDCGLGVMMPTSPHAHLIQQQQTSRNNNVKVRSPCCTPTKMSGISMLYLDPNKNVILGKLPRMKVDKCGCA